MSQKSMLLILDGWGIGQKDDTNAIFKAKTPFVDNLYTNYPHSTLKTSGEDVGLPQGQMGNSEVGHLNIGAGRIVYQELLKINNAFDKKEVEQNEALISAINYVNENKKPLHLMGLVSDGGVHSHILHLEKLCAFLNEKVENPIYIHAFTDGRDTDPKSGYGYISDLQSKIENTKIQIASITGRYYAMDRDKRWERVAIAYNALVHGVGKNSEDLLQSIKNEYEQGVTDEFIKPIIKTQNQKAIATINEGDAVICFNFRTDRCREIVSTLSQKNYEEYAMKKIDNLYMVTFTEYDKSFENVKVVFYNEDISKTLGEVLEGNHKKQIRIAETEKYPHVTFFFSGGREKEFEGEKRIMIQSPKEVATYDLKPEMSALGITEAILPEIENETADFICLNFANTDMVGHTGVFEAVIKAAETVDDCLSKIVPLAIEKNYEIIIIADHGNADMMVNADGTPNTAHTTNLVPIIYVSKVASSHTINAGRLADVAPTLLSLMQLPQPKEMSGEILIK